ncbi:winged helix-turn-helix domain-containing protein [Methylococcus sp. EFPC2]|nr:winged helix-turn-helix domain-containing protein [Methylococcus sp. EFPC2]
MGPGKADLLEGIVKTGSISAAGRSMEMSYRRAWLLVDEMNHCFKAPLVETVKGGQRGGGARLTPLGVQVLEKYRLMNASSKQAAAAYLGLFKDLMADTPPPPHGSGHDTVPDAPVEHTDGAAPPSA